MRGNAPSLIAAGIWASSVGLLTPARPAYPCGWFCLCAGTAVEESAVAFLPLVHFRGRYGATNTLGSRQLGRAQNLLILAEKNPGLLSRLGVSTAGLPGRGWQDLRAVILCGAVREEL